MKHSNKTEEAKAWVEKLALDPYKQDAELSFHKTAYINDPYIGMLHPATRGTTQHWTREHLQQIIREVVDFGDLDDRVCVVIFGNPYFPGGDFLKGGNSSEAELCHCSTLYPVLEKFSNVYEVRHTGNNFFYVKDCIVYPYNYVIDVLVTYPGERSDFVRRIHTLYKYAKTRGVTQLIVGSCPDHTTAFFASVWNACVCENPGLFKDVTYQVLEKEQRHIFEYYCGGKLVVV